MDSEFKSLVSSDVPLPNFMEDDPNLVEYVKQLRGAIKEALEGLAEDIRKLDSEVGAALFLKADGKVALSADWNAGADYGITIGTLIGTTLQLAVPTQLTISSGVVTATQTRHSVETEGGAASDDLNTINGGTDGMVLILKAANASHTVVCKDVSGNLNLNGDFSLDSTYDRLVLMFSASGGGRWVELSRSDNA